MWGGRGPSRRFICCCIPLIFFLTLFDCERGRRGRRGVASILLHDPLCPSFHFRGGGGDRKEEEGDRPFLACQELSHNPESDLRRTEPSLSISLLLPTLLHTLPANLHYTPLCLLPPSSSSSLIFPLFCCWGNAIWHG